MLNKYYETKRYSYYGYARHEMIGFVPKEAARILDIGCGDGGFGAALKADRVVHIIGIEPVEDAWRAATQRLDQVLHMNVEDGIGQFADHSFDCIVCNDVIEHLVDPWEVLRGFRRLLAPSGVLVASIPNVRHMPVLKDLVMQGNWRYEDAGVLDRTHLRFFTRNSIYDLFKTSGYQLTTVQGINAIDFPWKFGLFNRILNGLFDDAKFIQFACVAEISDS